MGRTDSVIRAFSEEHAAKLTGLSIGQLRSWDRRGFFPPQYAYEDRSAAYSRIYSFKDIVGLRTISVLMKRHRVSLQQLRRVAEELIRRGYEHWADLNLYVIKKQVHFQEPSDRKVEGVWDGQLAMVQIIDVINDVETRVSALQHRSDDQRGKVEKHKYVMRNASVVAGTRIPTAAIRRYHEAGFSMAQILKEYPSLSEGDVIAALRYEEGLAKSA